MSPGRDNGRRRYRGEDDGGNYSKAERVVEDRGRRRGNRYRSSHVHPRPRLIGRMEGNMWRLGPLGSGALSYRGSYNFDHATKSPSQPAGAREDDGGLRRVKRDSRAIALRREAHRRRALLHERDQAKESQGLEVTLRDQKNDQFFQRHRALESYLAAEARAEAHYESRNLFIRPLLPEGEGKTFLSSLEARVSGLYQNPERPAFTYKTLMDQLLYSFEPFSPGLERDARYNEKFKDGIVLPALGNMRTGVIYHDKIGKWTATSLKPMLSQPVPPGDYMFFLHDESKCRHSVLKPHLLPLQNLPCVRPAGLRYKKRLKVHKPSYALPSELLASSEAREGFRLRIRNRDRRCLLTGYNFLHRDSTPRSPCGGFGTGVVAAHVIPRSLPNLWTAEIHAAIYRQRGTPDERKVPSLWILENGILLRRDLERSLDEYHWTVDPNTRKVVVLVPDDHLMQFHGQDIYKYVEPENMNKMPVMEQWEVHYHQAMLRALRVQPPDDPEHLGRFPWLMKKPDKLVEVFTEMIGSGPDPLTFTKPLGPVGETFTVPSAAPTDIAPTRPLPRPRPEVMTREEAIEASEVIKGLLDADKLPFRKLYVDALMEHEDIHASAVKLAKKKLIDESEALEIREAKLLKKVADREAELSTEKADLASKREASRLETEKQLAKLHAQQAELKFQLEQVDVINLKTWLEESRQRSTLLETRVKAELSNTSALTAELKRVKSERQRFENDTKDQSRTINELQANLEALQKKHKEQTRKAQEAVKRQQELEKRLGKYEVPGQIQREDNPLYAAPLPPPIQPPNPGKIPAKKPAVPPLPTLNPAQANLPWYIRMLKKV